jgi:hypothetical protein
VSSSRVRSAAVASVLPTTSPPRSPLRRTMMTWPEATRATVLPGTDSFSEVSHAHAPKRRMTGPFRAGGRNGGHCAQSADSDADRVIVTIVLNVRERHVAYARMAPRSVIQPLRSNLRGPVGSVLDPEHVTQASESIHRSSRRPSRAMSSGSRSVLVRSEMPW